MVGDSHFITTMLRKGGGWLFITTILHEGGGWHCITTILRTGGRRVFIKTVLQEWSEVRTGVVYSIRYLYDGRVGVGRRGADGSAARETVITTMAARRLRSRLWCAERHSRAHTRTQRRRCTDEYVPSRRCRAHQQHK